MISHRTHTAHLENCVNRSQRNELQIKPFRNISLFAIQSLFFCFHEIFLAYFHSAFSQSKHTCFRTHGLDIGTTEFISALNELFQIDIVRQRHLVGMNIENVSLCLGIRERKFDLTIDTTRTNEGRIKTFDSIRGHDDLHVAALIKTIQLIQKFQHSTLNLSSTTTGRIVTFASHSIDFINEHDCRTQVVGNSEEFPNEFWTISEILLNQFGSHNTQKRSRGVVGNGLGEQCFTSSRLPVQNNSLRRFDTDIFVEFRMRKWKLNRLFDFLDLVFETSYIRVAFEWRLIDLHDTDHGIGVIRQYPNDTHRLVVQQDRASGVEQVLVDAGENIDVIFGTDRGTHNGMIVVDKFFQVTDSKWRTTQLFEFFPLFLVALLTRLEDFVVANKFLLHEKVILHTLQFQKAQLAFRRWNNRGCFINTGGTLATAAASLTIGRTWLESLFLFLLFTSFGIILPVSISTGGRSVPTSSSWNVTHCK
mmetsp:Transcript_3239/g.6729  ORF Transcript_3239/g.6729 Transcript_3239/m.6729 type:complete len:477 (-) Transcript_3239:80-1510(-)